LSRAEQTSAAPTARRAGREVGASLEDGRLLLEIDRYVSGMLRFVIEGKVKGSIPRPW
jgi:hypothetical protein